MIASSSAWAADKMSLGGQDWRDTLPSAPTQGAPGSDAFPGSFLIPGANTRLRIGGYVKLDLLNDLGKNPGDFISWGKIPTSADGALNNRRGDVRLHGRQSRFDVETRTPTSWGDLKTYIEGDFFGASGAASDLVTNATSFAVRHAYGELGHFLAGQTWSLAMDLDSAPETLDFGGPAGFVFIREGSIRWTQPFGPVTVAGSVENPESDFIGKGGNNAIPDADVGGFPALANRNISPNALNRIPDFVGRVSWRPSFGEVSIYAVAREIIANTGTLSNVSGFTNQIANASTFGWQTGFAGMLHTVGKDNLRFQANYGQGGARYINNFGGQSVAWNGAGLIEAQTVYGGYVYYQHWWNSTLRSNVGIGGVRALNDANIIGPIVAGGQNPTRSTYGSHANLIWSPLPNTNFGIEYSYGQRREENGATGTIKRLQFSAQYLF
jgi:hypothetical protein